MKEIRGWVQWRRSGRSDPTEVGGIHSSRGGKPGEPFAARAVIVRDNRRVPEIRRSVRLDIP
jgi:hypothetical protein